MEKYFECEPQIKKQIARKIVDKNKREDLQQEVFIKYHTKFSAIKNHDNLCGYLYRITENIINDSFRGNKKFSEIDPQLAQQSIDLTQLSFCCLDSYLQQLPKKYSEALVQVHIYGKSQKALASLLNISYTALKSRVQRGRNMLKNIILAEGEYVFDKYGNIIGCCVNTASEK